MNKQIWKVHSFYKKAILYYVDLACVFFPRKYGIYSSDNSMGKNDQIVG